MRRGTTNLAHKAEKPAPPPWFRDSTTLKLLLQGAWEKVSSEWADKLIAAIRSGDVAAVERLAKEAEQLGIELPDMLGDKVAAISSNLLLKAESFWLLHAKDEGIKSPKAMIERYREKLALAHAEQIKTFAAKFPERIIHPELVRQLDYLKETKTPDAIVIATMAERLETFTNGQNYWPAFTDVQISRIWHGQGVLHAQENGIRTGRVTGPLDAKTCPVCRHMLGLPVDIDDMADRVNAGIYETDTDKYVEMWRFPRLNDVDNISREELAKKGFFVPLHPHCRHSIAWLYKKKRAA